MSAWRRGHRLGDDEGLEHVLAHVGHLLRGGHLFPGRHLAAVAAFADRSIKRHAVEARARGLIDEVAWLGVDEVGARAGTVAARAVAGGAVGHVKSTPALGIAAQAVGEPGRHVDPHDGGGSGIGLTAAMGPGAGNGCGGRGRAALHKTIEHVGREPCDVGLGKLGLPRHHGRARPAVRDGRVDALPREFTPGFGRGEVAWHGGQRARGAALAIALVAVADRTVVVVQHGGVGRGPGRRAGGEGQGPGRRGAREPAQRLRQWVQARVKGIGKAQQQRVLGGGGEAHAACCCNFLATGMQLAATPGQ